MYILAIHIYNNKRLLIFTCMHLIFVIRSFIPNRKCIILKLIFLCQYRLIRSLERKLFIINIILLDISYNYRLKI